jgi:hypothetical protein
MSQNSGWLSQSPEFKQLSTEQRRLALEERVIKRIWDQHGCRPANLGAQVRDCKQQTGKDTLNFEWFHNTYPRFPVMLGAAKIDWTQNIQVGDLFGAFTKLSFFKEYEKFVDEIDLNPAVDQAALIFPWAHIPKGGSAMVLHNSPVDTVWDCHHEKAGRGTRIMRPLGNPVVIYVVESLNDFLMNVGTEWVS